MIVYSCTSPLGWTAIVAFCICITSERRWNLSDFSTMLNVCSMTSAARMTSQEAGTFNKWPSNDTKYWSSTRNAWSGQSNTSTDVRIYNLISSTMNRKHIMAWKISKVVINFVTGLQLENMLLAQGLESWGTRVGIMLNMGKKTKVWDLHF